MWTIEQIFIEFVTILLLFYVLVFWPHGKWGLDQRANLRWKEVLITGPPGKSLHYLNILLVFNLTCSNTKLTFAPCKSLGKWHTIQPTSHVRSWRSTPTSPLSLFSCPSPSSEFIPSLVSSSCHLLSAKPPSLLTLMTAAASSFAFSNLFSRYAAITPLFCLKPPYFL